jgi:hypothetical protein
MRAFKPQQVWAIRFYLDRERRLLDRALFDLAIDSKLRGCDVVNVRIGDLVSGARVRSRRAFVVDEAVKSRLRNNRGLVKIRTRIAPCRALNFCNQSHKGGPGPLPCSSK